jgi:toxin ParE1/3/4
MKSFRVKVLALAERDLIDIWLSIAEHSNVNADRFVDLLNSRIDSLADFPDRGVMQSDIARDARILVEGNYLIFYRKRRSDVEVLRVVHGAMDLQNLKTV